MRCLGVMVAALCAACTFDTALVPCGDNLCPTGSVCASGDRCATSEQLTACEGLDDGAACSAGNIVGKCDAGLCTATGCGNAQTEAGEECDDGNMESGDGCRADCQKIEVCGDAVLDDGEGCDDGNTNTADGCDACVPTRWRVRALVGGNPNATSISMTPTALAADLQGNVFMVDDESYYVRRLDPTGVMLNVAGDGTFDLDGDGGPAITAAIGYVTGVAVDTIGNLYLMTQENCTIRRVDETGIITTVAGTGTCGANSGDGGPATAAQLDFMYGIAVDGLGAIYVSAGSRIRRVDTTGIITTFAGTDLTTYNGENVPAATAQISPGALAFDVQGELYLVDFRRIRRIGANGLVVTIAGTGGTGSSTGDGGPATAAQIFPGAIAFDGGGNLYLSEYDRIRRIDTSGIITTITGTDFGFSGDGGPALDAEFGTEIMGLATTSDGSLYLSDTYNHRLRKITNGIVTTVAGTGFLPPDGNGAGTQGGGEGAAAIAADLSFTQGIGRDAQGTVHFTSPDGGTVRKIGLDGVLSTVAGNSSFAHSGDGGPATAAGIVVPTGVAFDTAGNMYICDRQGHRIRKVDTNGIISTIAGTGAETSTGDGGPAAAASLSRPLDLDVDAQGNVFVAELTGNRVRKIAANGTISTLAAVSAPRDVAVEAGGTVLATLANGTLVRIATNGTVSTIAGGGATLGDGGPASNALLESPWGVDVDAAGNIFVSGNSRIRKITAQGVITTIAGDGNPGFSGDGGPGTSAALDLAYGGVEADGQGGVYFCDNYNRLVRHISAAGIITTVAGRVAPDGVGPFSRARLADPRALFALPGMTLVAGGLSGTVEAVRTTSMTVESAAGRYFHDTATGVLARYRDRSFGTVAGVAYKPATKTMYLTESTTNTIHAVTIIDEADVGTWTIGTLPVTGLNAPSGLHYHATNDTLYVADTGNHIVRAINLATNAISTVAGVSATRGYFGDNGSASTALLYAPRAITVCTNSDLFIADTGNHRIRRVAGGMMTTVLGDGVAASSGEGAPSRNFPIAAPSGLACDASGNVLATSSTAVRMLPSNELGVVDGAGKVSTIYGTVPRLLFPERVTSCLSGIAIVNATTVHVADSCTGILVELVREPTPP